MVKVITGRERLLLADLVSLIVGVVGLGIITKLTHYFFPYLASWSSFFYLSFVKVAYLFSIVIIPIIIWQTYKICSRWSTTIRPRLITKLNFGLLISIGVGIVVFVGKIDWQFYYGWAPDQLMIYLSPKTYILAILFLGVCLLGQKYWKARNLVIAVILGVAAYLAHFVIINDIHRYNASALNLSVVMHSVVQVFLGKAVLIDQKSQYGLYAHFLEPIFRLWGEISVFNFSLVMAILVFVSMGSLGLFLWLTLKNKWIALVGFFATMYFHYFVGQMWPEELYLQYYPIRTLFPTLLLPLYHWYRLRPNKAKYWLLWIVMAIGVLWNLDVGVFGYFALWVVHCYHAMETSGEWKTNIRNIATLTWHSASVLVGVIGTFLLYEHWRYGTWPLISELFSAQILFLNESIPLLFYPWTLIVLIYLLGTIFAIKHLFQKRKSLSGELVALITILGVGIFIYFLNNPHESVLTNCGYPAIILLTLLIDNGFREKKIRIYTWIGLLIICFMSASFLQNLRFSRLLFDTVTIQDIVSPDPNSAKSMWAIKQDCLTCVDFVYEGDYARDRALKPSWVMKKEYVMKYRLPNKEIRDDILILSNWDYLLYLSAYAKAPLKMVNFHHLYLESEWEELFALLTNRESKYIIVDEEQLIVVGAEKSHPKDKIERLWTSIRGNYHQIRREQVGDEYYDWQWNPNYLSTWEKNEI